MFKYWFGTLLVVLNLMLVSVMTLSLSGTESLTRAEENLKEVSTLPPIIKEGAFIEPYGTTDNRVFKILKVHGSWIYYSSLTKDLKPMADPAYWLNLSAFQGVFKEHEAK